MSLYDDAFSEYGNRNGALSYTYNSTIYSPYDFINDSFANLFSSAINENGFGTRAIFLPNTTQPISLNNTQIISMIRGAYFIVQENWDAYLFIIGQITNGTITTTGQISPAWTSYLSTYTNNRLIEPTNESLAASIAGMPSQVQSNWTQTSSSAVDYIKNKPAARSQSSASRTLNSVFQISSTRDSSVSYSVDISCTLSLATGQSGTVFLEIASDSGFTLNVQELCRIANASSGTLTLGLNLVQDVTGVLNGYVPGGYYCRLRTVNTTGSPTFVFRSGQEVLL